MASWKTIKAAAPAAVPVEQEAVVTAPVSAAPAARSWKTMTANPESLTPEQEATLDEETGASLGVRAAVGALEKAEDRKRALESYYGVGNVKPKGDDNFTFKNPETGNWTVYNPEGWLPDAGDFASIAPEIGETVGAIGGAIAGAGAGTVAAPGVGTILGGMGGAGVGAAAGREGTIGLINMLSGQDDTRTWGETGVDALQTAGLNAGGELIGPVAKVGWKFGKNLLDPAGYIAAKEAGGTAGNVGGAVADKYSDSAFSVNQLRQMAFKDAGLEDASTAMDLSNTTGQGIGSMLVRLIGAANPIMNRYRQSQHDILKGVTDLYTGGRGVAALPNENDISGTLTKNINGLVGGDGILQTARDGLYGDLGDRLAGTKVAVDGIENTLDRMSIPKERGGLNEFNSAALLNSPRYGGELPDLMGTVRSFLAEGEVIPPTRPRPRSGSFADDATNPSNTTGAFGETAEMLGRSSDSLVPTGAADTGGAFGGGIDEIGASAFTPIGREGTDLGARAATDMSTPGTAVAPFNGRVDPYAGRAAGAGEEPFTMYGQRSARGGADDAAESAFGAAPAGAGGDAGGGFSFTANATPDTSRYVSSQAALAARAGLKIAGADGKVTPMVQALRGSFDDGLDTALKQTDPDVRLDLDFMGPVARTYDAGDIVRDAARDLGQAIPAQGAFDVGNPVDDMLKAGTKLLAKPDVQVVKAIESAVAAGILSPAEASQIAASSFSRMGKLEGSKAMNAFELIARAKDLSPQVRAKMLAVANSPELLAQADGEAGAFGSVLQNLKNADGERLVSEGDMSRMGSIRRYAEGDSPLSDIRTVNDGVTEVDRRARALDLVDQIRRESLGALNGSNTAASSEAMHRVIETADVPNKAIRGDAGGILKTAAMWALPPLLGKGISSDGLKRAVLKQGADAMAEKGYRDTVSAFGNSVLGRAIMPSARRAMQNQKAATQAAFERAGLLDDKWIKQGEVFDPLARNTGASLESAFGGRGVPLSERATAISHLLAQRYNAGDWGEPDNSNRAAFGN